MTERNIEKKFECGTEAADYIREIFSNIQAGLAYYGRIVVKKAFFGCDEDNNFVVKYTNKGEELYVTNAPYNFIITSKPPRMNWQA